MRDALKGISLAAAVANLLGARLDPPRYEPLAKTTPSAARRAKVKAARKQRQKAKP